MALPKTFSSGERLFASDLNGNFEDLDTRLGTIDLEDLANVSGSATDGQVLAYDNGTSTWNPTDGGVIIAVKSALFTGTQTNSTAAGADFAITDLTITHEVADASNKLILMATCGVLASSVGTLESGIAFHDGSSLIGIGTAAGNRTSVSTGGLGKESGAGNGISGAPHAFTLVHTPGTGSKTYTVRAFNTFSSTQTIYVNRTPTDTDNVRFVRGASSFVLMEVKV